jgi:hypothetical protein
VSYMQRIVSLRRDLFFSSYYDQSMKCVTTIKSNGARTNCRNQNLKSDVSPFMKSLKFAAIWLKFMKTFGSQKIFMSSQNYYFTTHSSFRNEDIKSLTWMPRNQFFIWSMELWSLHSPSFAIGIWIPLFHTPFFCEPSVTAFCFYKCSCQNHYLSLACDHPVVLQRTIC